jgi:hypothetical protein
MIQGKLQALMLSCLLLQWPFSQKMLAAIGATYGMIGTSNLNPWSGKAKA